MFARASVGSGLSMTPGRVTLVAGRPSVSPAIRLTSCFIEKSLVKIDVCVDGKPVDYQEALPRGNRFDRQETTAKAPVTKRISSNTKVPLVRLAVARSGDKGDDANIGVIAREPRFLLAILAELTADVVKQYFAHLCQGTVERYELPGICGLNFVLRESLGGGGTSSTRLDTQAKSYAQLLLEIPIPIEAELLDTLPA